MTTPLLTSARRRALEVIAATHPRPARVSNTTAKTAGVALVYWQSADWLTAEGLVRPTDGGGLVLTAAGVIACRAADIEIVGGGEPPLPRPASRLAPSGVTRNGGAS